ncbi:MAG: hydrogenase maturation nickel metallochaperone HypA [Bacteroidota bacterium]
MHELSIALSIIELAENEAGRAGGKEIKELELEVGLLAGVDLDALEFSLEMSKKETILENAILKIDKIPGLCHCRECLVDFPVDDLYSACPDCKSYSHDLIKGDELRIKSIVIE